MSTRSFIGMADKFFDDRTFDHCKIVYCHWDGYPENNGRILLEHYNTAEKINKLVNLGGMSSLDETIEKCGFYNEENELPTVYRYKEFMRMVPDSWVNYIYLYDLSKNKWMYARNDGATSHFDDLSNYFSNIRCCVGIAEHVDVDEESLENCRVAYVNKNGSPDDVGNILVDYYNSKELVEELLSHGGMTCLGDSAKTSKYYRTNSKRSKVVECANTHELLSWENSFFRNKDFASDYAYLYDLSDSKWKCIETYWNENDNRREVNSAVILEFE